MLKKGFIFSLVGLLLTALWMYPVGMFIAWGVVEAGEPIVALLAAITSCAVLLIVTYFGVKWRCRDCLFTKSDIIKFLIPYFVLLLIFVLLFIPQLFGGYDVLKNSKNEILSWVGAFMDTEFLACIVPAGYTAGFLSSLFENYCIVLLWGTVLLSIIHMGEIALILNRIRKNNAE